VDGARVLFDGGWGLIRASNTQPVLVLRFEARDHERLGEIRRIFMEKVGKEIGISSS
jgi:phosphomannomutase/phosphoglucomutase